LARRRSCGARALKGDVHATAFQRAARLALGERATHP